MTDLTVALDCEAIEVPMDAWSEPFWAAAAEHRLLVPHCGDCGLFRWPPGPFCPDCHSQAVAWTPPGEGRIYTFTLLPRPARDDGQPGGFTAPALIEFADAPGLRLLSTIVGAPIDSIQIGAAVRVDWAQAANAAVPVFRLS